MPDRHTIELDQVEATLKGLRLPIGLVLDRVEISGGGLQVRANPTEYKLNRPGSLRVVVHVDSVARFLNAKSPASLSDFEVHTSGDQLVVKVKAKVVVSVNVTAGCKLEIADGRQLFVRLQSVGKLGSAVRNLVQGQLDQINPVFNVDDLPIQARLDQVSLSHGEIVLQGSVLGPA